MQQLPLSKLVEGSEEQGYVHSAGTGPSNQEVERLVSLHRLGTIWFQMLTPDYGKKERTTIWAPVYRC